MKQMFPVLLFLQQAELMMEHDGAAFMARNYNKN